jgi:hypothetical protein
LAEQLTALATAVGALIAQVQNDGRGRVGDLTTLTTVQKGSLVAALNELKAALDSYSQIDDAVTGTNSGWSSQKVRNEITTAINSLLSGVGEDQNTLLELANSIAALAQADTGLVSAAAAQNFTAAQQAVARSNIGAVSTADIGDTAAMNLTQALNSGYLGTT